MLSVSYRQDAPLKNPGILSFYRYVQANQMVKKWKGLVEFFRAIESAVDWIGFR
jgi:hypothetical protein